MKIYKKIVSLITGGVFLLSNILPALLITSPLVLTSVPASAAQRTPAWWTGGSAQGVLPDWHYRVPITTPSSARPNSMIKVDIDFAAELADLGVAGTFDDNSVRVVRADTTVVATQEYTPGIYAGATNAVAARGEIRFLAETSGAVIYYVYFDITQNGTKPASTQTRIGGNFEPNAFNVLQPVGWSASRANTTIDAAIRQSETANIATDGTTVGTASASPKGVGGGPLTGRFAYMMGNRTNNEGSNYPSATLTKTFTVPLNTPGNLVFKYRIQGWGSAVNDVVNSYDYFAVKIVGTTTTHVVGPEGPAYSTYPFSPNYGASAARLSASGYGQYNGFDNQNGGGHAPQAGNATMSVNLGAEPWWTVTQSLAAYAGQTVTLQFTMNSMATLKSWVTIDDVEWSVLTATVGVAQAFGMEFISPTAATQLMPGDVFSLIVRVDAAPKTYVTAEIYPPTGTTPVATNIRLYNDGTHGSDAGTPHLWYNDGSDPASPTYTIPANAQASTAWTVKGFALDGSTTTIAGIPNGLIHFLNRQTRIVDTNFYNMDDNTFQVRLDNGAPTFTVLKSVSTVSDPYNLVTNPYDIPGAQLSYSTLITNSGNGSPDVNTMSIIEEIPAGTWMYVKDLGDAGSGPILFTDGTPTSGLTYLFSGFGIASTNVAFSSNGGTNFTYIPTANGQGYDQNVTHFKISPQGVMNYNETNNPNFTYSYRVQIR